MTKVASKGTIGLRDMTEEGLNDPVMRSLLDKVNVYTDEELEKNFGRGISPAKITVHTTCGDFTDCIFQKGHPTNPFTDADMERKFKDCFSFGIYEQKEGAADQILSAIDHLEDLKDFTELIRMVNDSFAK